PIMDSRSVAEILYDDCWMASADARNGTDRPFAAVRRLCQLCDPCRRGDTPSEVVRVLPSPPLPDKRLSAHAMLRHSFSTVLSTNEQGARLDTRAVRLVQPPKRIGVR